MKLNQWMTFQAVLTIAFGIALSLYAPLVLAFLGLPDAPEANPVLYWNVAAFARLFGAALFGLGFVILGLRTWATNSGMPAETRRGLLFSLVLAYGMATFVAVTQQFSVWNAPLGWVFILFFGLSFAGYGYFLVTQASEKAIPSSSH